MTEQCRKTMDNLRRNRMNVVYVPDKAGVPDAVRALLKSGDAVAVGGSVTLDETGVTALLRSGEYRFLDRYAPGLTGEQVEDILRRSLAADVFLCSSNAVTENGELYNVDGRANRVAALAFGPRRVIVVVSTAKIVPDLAAAIRRVKTVAAPRNAQRLHCRTYCAQTGHCVQAEGGMTDGCQSPDRICCDALVSGWQRDPERMHVILVDEPCGY